MSSAARVVGKLVPKHSALFVCDIQERFRPVIHAMTGVIDTSKRMVRSAGLLGMPVLVTEQYPKALGPTVSELQEVLKAASATRVEKTLFSMITPEVHGWLESKPDVKQILLLGIEAHVCVLQTTLDLVEKGYEVHLLVDGISSQRELDRGVALQRMAQAGGYLCTSEMAMFQLLGSAKHPQFKQISELAKERSSAPTLDSMPGMPGMLSSL